MHSFFPCRWRIAISPDQTSGIPGMADDIHFYICEKATHVNFWNIEVSKNYFRKVI